MVTELLGKAHLEADRQKIRRHPQLAQASARLAMAVRVMLEADMGAVIAHARFETIHPFR